MALGGSVAQRRVVELSIVGKGVDQEGNRLRGVLQSLERQADRTTKTFDRVDSKLGNFNGTLKKIVAGAGVATGIAAVGTAFRQGFDAANDFQSALSNLSAITGATGKDLQYLSDQAIDISKNSRTAARDVVEGFKLIGSAKPDLLASGEALSEVTRQAVLLKEAASIDLATASKSLATALNQFGEGADQAARFVNVLAAGSQLGSAEVDALAQATVKAGTAAAGANVSFEEFIGLVGTLAASGAPIETIGTGLKNIFITLESGARETRPSVVGLDKALENLAAQQLDTAEIAKQFGRENFNVVKSMIEMRGKADDLEKAITGTNTAFEQAQTNADNVQGAMANLSNSFTNFAIVVFEKSETIKSSINGIASFVNGLTDNYTRLKTEATQALTDLEEVHRGFASGVSDAFSLAFSDLRTIIDAISASIKGGLETLGLDFLPFMTLSDILDEVSAGFGSAGQSAGSFYERSILGLDQMDDRAKRLATSLDEIAGKSRNPLDVTVLPGANDNTTGVSSSAAGTKAKDNIREMDAAILEFNKHQLEASENLNKLFAGQFTEIENLQQLAAAAANSNEAYEATKIHLEAINIARENGIDLQSQEVAAIEAYLHQREDLNNEIEKSIELNKKNEEAFKGFAEAMKADLPDIGDSIQTSLASGLTDTILAFNNAEDAFKSFATTFLRQIAQMIIQQIIFNALSAASGGGFGGAIAGAFANGAAFQGGNVIPFASGGVVDRPTVFPMARGMGLMGEAGPEAVVPLRRDSQGRLGVSSTAPTINIINNAGADVRVTRSDDEIIEIAVERATRANEAIYTRSMRDGYGPYSRGLEQGYRAKRRLG